MAFERKVCKKPVHQIFLNIFEHLRHETLTLVEKGFHLTSNFVSIALKFKKSLEETYGLKRHDKMTKIVPTFIIGKSNQSYFTY